jgi:hypothetical protein
MELKNHVQESYEVGHKCKLRKHRWKTSKHSKYCKHSSLEQSKRKINPIKQKGNKGWKP